LIGGEFTVWREIAAIIACCEFSIWLGSALAAAILSPLYFGTLYLVGQVTQKIKNFRPGVT
jgi:hypothetical protein